MSKAKNVLGGPLQTCSMRPLTGFYRNGCCDTGPEDEGLHTICCQVTAEVLAHQRGMRTAGGIAAGGGGLLLLILGLIFGVDTGRLGIGDRPSGPPPNDNYKEFASKVVGSLEAVWQKEFAKNGYGAE